MTGLVDVINVPRNKANKITEAFDGRATQVTPLGDGDPVTVRVSSIALDKSQIVQRLPEGCTLADQTHEVNGVEIEDMIYEWNP